MKRIVLFFIIAFGCLTTLAMADKMVDIKQYPSCSYCGMKRDMFAHSRMLTTYTDKSQFAACSLHCAALNFANQIDKTVAKIEVADFNTKELVNAEEAIWVIGGKIKGVMTARAKWAFADIASADSFIAANGGERTDFDSAMKAAFEDMYRDTTMIRKKRAEMHMKKKNDDHSHQ